MDGLIRHLVSRKKRAAFEEIAQITGHVAAAPFAGDPLEVDEPLWGSFWHGDVIAPGYTLPAEELALLRATRLEGHWPEGTTREQYLADLRQAIRHPQAGVWTLAVDGEPCVVFGARSEERRVESEERGVTVAWYCATTGRLHAGYRTVGGVRLVGAVEQRAPGFLYPSQHEPNDRLDWLELVLERREVTAASSLAARLDAEILRMRLGQSA
jgi:hypothetical protein